MILNTHAIVLHRMKYKNSSLIARLFTKDEGKISIISNGAGKQKGNLFGVIEPPNLIKVSYTKRNLIFERFSSRPFQNCLWINFSLPGTPRNRSLKFTPYFTDVRQYCELQPSGAKNWSISEQNVKDKSCF